jgi:hypothetical protein
MTARGAHDAALLRAGFNMPYARWILGLWPGVPPHRGEESNDTSHTASQSWPAPGCIKNRWLSNTRRHQVIAQRH